MTMYLIAALGLVIGIVSAILGAGPSILTVLLLTNIAGLALHRAVATSLVAVLLMSLAALVPYAMEKAVVWRFALAFGLASMTGAYLSGHIAGVIPERVLQVIFFMATVVASVSMLWKRPTLPRDQGRRRPGWQTLAVLAVGGALVGCLTGLVGLGGGFAIVPLLVVFAGTPVHAAMGTSILVIAMNTMAGLAGHLPHPPVDWRIAACLSASECAGSLAGARLSSRISAAVRRWAFAGLMLAASVLTLGRAIHG
ncbi:sulfite exporter TauE/SafE family protein [Sorangium sp. So ce834]|uniref:sulfite exporter TauE/SafE family protein n=1 Tax=Sorangium sp. So ce834 TaxID=3133321 RepID=UPI003F633410